MSSIPSPPAGPPSHLIATQAELDRWMAGIAHAALLAVDTEAASFHRYRDRVYLLQLSTRQATVVVDPLAVEDLGDFGAMLADRAVEVVFHDADYDLRLLGREFGFVATNLFDTRIAAQLLNEPGIGLAALLEKYVGVKLDKRFQRADWSGRPLSAGMLEYAASDTHYLPALRDILEGRLAAMGRLEWAREEFALLEQTAWVGEPPEEPGWLRMKGAKALRPRQLAILRELYEWRDALAQRLDRAAFRIMNNDPIFTMARTPPEDLDALAKVPGIGRDIVARRGADILAAIDRGRSVPESQLPRVERPARRAPDPELDARVERLKTARNAAATRIDLPPGVVCPNGTLEAVARAAPRSLEELAAIPGVRRWQVDVLGNDLVAAVGSVRTP
ncbi:MAG TPA: ribonuclease D [Gemmatimonadales bacterium]|nr:ribonuclease D [Gemmatimonadales bacterium]